MKKVVLIGGYGRSGSTLFELYCANTENLIPFGELRYAASHYANASRECLCGQLPHNCEYWENLNSLGLLSDNSVLKSSNVLNLFKSHEEVKSLYECLLASGNKSEGIVDSSKTTYGSLLRPLIVAKAVKKIAVVEYVGLFRDPVSVYRSMLTGRNESLASNEEVDNKPVNRFSTMLRCLVGWPLANIAMILNYAILKGPHVSYILNYENFTRQCDDSNLSVIGKDSVHLLGGNRMAKKESIVINQQDSPKWNALSVDELLIRVLTLPLLLLLKLMARKEL